MVYQVQLTARAERDAAESMQYISERSPIAAARWHERLMKAVESLEQYPERCGLAPEAEELNITLRQLLFGKRRAVYRILFTVEGDRVNVLHIRHASRRLLQPGDL